MTARVIRLGAVSYLNAKPLVYGLEDPRTLGPSDPRTISLRFDVPSECARLLAAGEIDLGLVPSITCADRADERIVPGVSIASEGPVASVAIFTRRPIRDVRTLALDTSSRTSVVLTRILCARTFEIAPSFVDRAPDLPAMLAAADAALVIGDPALFADAAALGATRIDLGEAWTSMTGLPFVWAVWAGPRAAVTPDVVTRLQRARDEGVAASDAIANGVLAGDPARQAIGRRYLRENIKYGLTGRMLEGLRAYYREAGALGLVGAAREPRLA